MIAGLFSVKEKYATRSVTGGNCGWQMSVTSRGTLGGIVDSHWGCEAFVCMAGCFGKAV
jgi:hypothetical protein